MANDKRVNPVYRSISRPLTILGAERKLFFFAMCVGAGTFNLLGSLLGGILIFLLLYFAARWATETDPQILRFLLPRKDYGGCDQCGQATKGMWGMSWRQEAMKGVADCDNPGGVVKRTLIPGSPNYRTLNP